MIIYDCNIQGLSKFPKSSKIVVKPMEHHVPYVVTKAQCKNLGPLYAKKVEVFSLII